MEAEEDVPVSQSSEEPEGTKASIDEGAVEEELPVTEEEDVEPADGEPTDEEGELVDEEESLELTQEIPEEDDGLVSDNNMEEKGGGEADGEKEDEKVEAEESDPDAMETQEIEANEDDNETLKAGDGNEISEENEDEEMEEGAPGSTIKGEESSEEPHQEPVAAGGGIVTRKRTLSHSSGEDGPKRKVGRNVGGGGGVVGGGGQSSDGAKHDRFCWVCHKDGVTVNCKLCPRSYHVKCMSADYPNAKIAQGDSTCPCPECVVVMNAETIEFRSDAMKQLTLDQLMGLLKNVCLRMKQTPGVSVADPFVKPVDPNEAEDYFDYIVYPMDIETLEKNIKKRLYGSTEGFLADAQWLVHNSIVFNSASSSYTLQAKRLLKICKQELTEIETCPECYLNAHEKQDSWFLQACRRPHILVWAKLKGFPFWPAKAMKIKDNDVDVRFFGQHDRAWVAMKDCFLYSEEMPAAPPKKNGSLLSALEELNTHVDKLKEVHGPVVFSPAKTTIGPQLSVEQIRRMLPEYNPPEQPAKSQTATAASNVKTNPTTTTANNNNNNKVPPPPKKSPMTIRISSLKTNPTIVNNTAVSADDNAAASSEVKVVTRLTRKSSAAAQQNQSAGLSESEHSTDENQAAEAEKLTEENHTESVPDDNANGTDDEAAVQSVPKGSEILANALGGPLRRSTRGMSRSGDGSSSHALEPLTGAAAISEKRLTRSSIKGGSTADAGDETDESTGHTAAEEQPPDSVLEAMGLSKKSKDSPSPNQKLLIKGEPSDHYNDTDGELNTDISISTKTSIKNSQTLAEQLSAHSTTVKPANAYRFNLSKDISISAVDGGGSAGADDLDTSGLVNVGLSGTGDKWYQNAPQQRKVPQAIPMGVGGMVRPRMQHSSSILNGQQQQQRMFTGQQLRQMVRNARPQHILNPRTGQTVRIAGVPSANRPVSMIHVRNQQQQQHVVQKGAKDGSAADSSSVANTVQGPITLPGGTITVTPLSLMNAGLPLTSFDGAIVTQTGQHGAKSLKANPSTSAVQPTINLGIINLPQQSSGGTTIVNNAAGTGKSAKAGITSIQQRRNLMASIPPTVSLHLQNLTKTMGDLVKSTVEQITLEVIDFCNNTQGKAEASRLQSEVERLQNKLKQEVTDVKHNNDIALRELRITMENDKKRAIAEIKRQLETDKQKAVEETKKKQWCASCGREALFYCCWNTSYCGYPCQEEHWPSHMSSCSQNSR